MHPEILAKVIRGETVESIHRGHLIVLDGDGKEIFALGNPDFVTFFRSAAKPLQAIPFLLSGAAERFGFLENEIALACASHSGEPIHVATAAKMLQKSGLSESDLRCGSHLPFYQESAHQMIRNIEKPNQLHNNCSGKHSAMLAFAKHIGADLKNYEMLENPIQQQILKTVAEFTEIPKDEIELAIDGCAAVNFALSLRGMARSFAKLVFPPNSFDVELREACRRIVSAFMAYPELIGGTERLDTLIMNAASGKLICKVGAEGLWLCGVLPSPNWKRGLGIALKIEDGEDNRARPAVAVELLRQLEVLEADDLKELSPMPIKNWRGDLVGRVEVSLHLATK
ncbi:MAG TPA: asparaginase [Pyrinomonadaceae bacterium]|nr:asparaginase [Pyrinomonadaceae bacterium]